MTRRGLLVLSAWVALSAASCRRGGDANAGPPHPVAEFPESIDLGTRERGEVATAAFSIANRGGTELVLDQFNSNCSCSGIERKQGGEYVRVETLKVKPGEEIEVIMRVSVRGVPIGSCAKNGVTFRTNDPNRPAGRIEAVIGQVTGGVFVVPDDVVIGAVPVGGKVRTVVDVRDDAVTPRRLGRATSSQDRVWVRILEKAESDPPGRAGRSIAQLEITVDTSTPGNIDSAVTLHLAGDARTPDRLRVIGRVVSPVELAPARLVLPRASPEGLIYSGNCSLRSTDGRPLAVAVESCPDGVTCEVSPAGGAASPSSVLKVTCDPKRLERTPHECVIRLKCQVGEATHRLDLRVLVGS